MARATHTWILISIAGAAAVGVACSAPDTGDLRVKPGGDDKTEGTAAGGDAPYLGVDDVLAETAKGGAQGVNPASDDLDTSLDDRVVPKEELDDPDNHFDSEEDTYAPGAFAPSAPAAVPASLDLRRLAKITNQESEGSCTAYAVAGAMQMVALSAGQRDDMSSQHLWNLQSKRPNVWASLQTALRGWLAPISIWPNGSFTKATVANPAAYGYARLESAAAIPRGVRTVIAELAKSRPVVMASTLNDSWRRTTSRGVIDPKARATGRWMHAAHAYDLVGYVDDTRFEDGGYFIVKNSWGPTWGDKGYAYVPYSYCRYQAARTDGGYCLFYSVGDVETRGQAPPKDAGAGPTDAGTPATGSYAVKVRYGAASGTNMGFQLYVEASAADLARVERVVYDVHPTFGTAAKATVTDAATKFATVTYSTYASGWSTKGAALTLKDGQTVALPGVVIRWK